MNFTFKAAPMGLLSFITVSTLVLAGSAAADVSKGNPGFCPHRVAHLKSQIITLATANQTRRDNIVEVRAELQPLVDELLSITPERAESEKAAQVAGGWYSLWSDYRFGPFVDYAQVYQVVDLDGFYYNISRNVAPFGTTTNYLRGAFVDAGSFLRIEFTRSISVNDWLTAGQDLVELSAAVESGAIDGPDDPRGPIGVEGNLQNAYVDSELRIVVGRSDGEPSDGMFVLVRSDVIR
jgi:hypothetical protein